MTDSFKTRTTLEVDGREYTIRDLSVLPQAARLPYSMKILLENLLRFEDGVTVTADDIQAVLDWHWSTSATASVMPSSSGGRRPSTTSRSYRPRPASCIR